MTNKELFELYEINKNGLINVDKKLCLCGEEVESSINVCPKCGAQLAKSKCLNVAKNTALAKREESKKEEGIVSYKQIHLMSTGFELYEQVMLEVTLNLETEEVKISNQAAFKKQVEGKGVFACMEKYLPGFYNMAMECIDSMQNGMFSRFSALSEAYISNILHVYLNYNALFPYLLKYKVLYFGGFVNLKTYFPDTNFNDKEEIKQIDLNLNLLKFWDIKNQKYIETIIEISKDKTLKADLDDMLEECVKETNRLIRNYWFDGNMILDTFSILFNKEIDIKNFIRIFKKSHPQEFFQLKKYNVWHKKIYRKNIDFTTLPGITKKDLKTLELKVKLKNMKISSNDIDDIFNTLEKNPLEALKMLPTEKN